MVEHTDTSEIFVDVDGDKYLAKVIKTFPPRSLSAPPSPYAAITATVNGHGPVPAIPHPLAMDLNLPLEEVIEKDDPMRYIYNVRLIEEGAVEGVAETLAESEKWQASTMEVQADKIRSVSPPAPSHRFTGDVKSLLRCSRDRLNFSRTLLKRFIRDCVTRESAVYSPWLVKPSFANRYGIPTEMTPEIRDGIARYRERQMDKRKRDRDERLGVGQGSEMGGTDELRSVDGESGGKPGKKSRRDEDRKMRKDEEERRKEEEGKKKVLRFPAEGESSRLRRDMLDGADGRSTAGVVREGGRCRKDTGSTDSCDYAAVWRSV